MEKKQVKESAITIILIDDDPSVIYYHEALLESRGTESIVQSFNEVSAALKFIAHHTQDRRNFVVLMDINMPVKNGWAFLSEAENLPNNPCLNVIVVTSSLNESDKLRAKNHPMVKGYFEKPLEDEDFNIILSELSLQADSF